MLEKIILPVFFLINCNCMFAQVYPTFGKEIAVTINGLTFDAMEPFISADGNTLFFNSLNDGVNTSLYYATKVNDSTFNFVGQVNGTNMPSPHLDAVASMDSGNNFFWVSNRNYPAVFENLQRGHYDAGNVTNKTKVYGDIYVHTPGWIVMDAGIDYYGEYLYYCNAYFNNCTGGMPCSAKLSIAQKVNDSTYNKTSNSDGIMKNINDVNYLVYAPCVTKNGLEYYYTRILISNPHTEICVSVRTAATDTFSLPNVIYTSSMTPEAATLTTDKNLMYYHKKPASLYKIFMRYRNNPTNTGEIRDKNKINVFSNPASDYIYFNIQAKEKFIVELFNITGMILKTSVNPKQLDISDMPNGVYVLRIIQDKNTYTKKIIKK